MRLTAILSAFLVFALAPELSMADVITYDISLTTGPLVGHVAGPFSIEFQLNDGSGANDGNNSVLLSNFVFGGGSAEGTPVLIGEVSGNASSLIRLTDSLFFNQFVQEFTPGLRLGFRLTLTTNTDAGGVPDEFSFAILDNSGVEIPTVASFYDVLLQIDINSANPLVQTYGTDPNRIPTAGGSSIDITAPAANEVAVPEPASWMMLIIGLGAIGVTRIRACRRDIDQVEASNPVPATDV
jgi:hypothetical protein